MSDYRGYNFLNIYRRLCNTASEEKLEKGKPNSALIAITYQGRHAWIQTMHGPCVREKASQTCWKETAQKLVHYHVLKDRLAQFLNLDVVGSCPRSRRFFPRSPVYMKDDHAYRSFVCVHTTECPNYLGRGGNNTTVRGSRLYRLSSVRLNELWITLADDLRLITSIIGYESILWDKATGPLEAYRTRATKNGWMVMRQGAICSMAKEKQCCAFFNG